MVGVEHKVTTAAVAPSLSSVVEQMRGLYARDLLSGQVALVTGGSRGIGKAIALAFSALGARVIVNYIGSQSVAEETLQEIVRFGEGVLSRFDVSDFSQVQEEMKRLEKEYGSIDILVNNAGVSKDNLFVRYKEEDWDATIDTNLKGAFNCSRAVSMSLLKKRAGKIINISSVIGLAGNAGQCAYSASKAGLLGLTKSLALEFAARNVQVNAIAPGYIVTDMTDSLSDQTAEIIKAKIPTRSLGLPVDVAKVAVFLASEASAYITGQTIAVDGGMVMF